MTYAFWDRIASTPWWVYALFIFGIRLSLQATKPRALKMKVIFLFPFIFLSVSLITMYFLMHPSLANSGIWMAGMLIGVILGWLHFRIKGIKAIKNAGELYIPGTWSVMVIVLLVFSWQMYSGYQLPYIDAHMILQGPYAAKLIGLYGLMTGLFIGRLVYSLRCMKFGPWMTEPLT